MSIYGVWQTALTHFDAFHIGLTATPAAYIERNTFDFYNCRNEQPDFTYSIQTAFEQKYLVPYRFATGITKIIAEGAEVDEVCKSLISRLIAREMAIDYLTGNCWKSRFMALMSPVR